MIFSGADCVGGIINGHFSMPLRLHTLPHVSFYVFWCVLVPSPPFGAKQGELQRWLFVRIPTGLGTMAETGGCVISCLDLWNFWFPIIGTWYFVFSFWYCKLLLEDVILTFGDIWIGAGKMNKCTRAVDESTFKLIIATMKNGFISGGVRYKPNERIATVLTLEYNLGLRVGDILNLCVDSFVKDAGRYRLDIYEQKTGKYRNFTVPAEVYQFVRDYAYQNNISSKAKLFPITERAVLKHLKAVCDYLGLEGIGSHSFRKGFATNIYVNNHYNIELVRTLLQHSSVNVTQRYIGIGTKELEDAIQKNICLG